MTKLDNFDRLFVVWAFVLQICLIVLFAIRKSNLEFILQYGWVFYLLSIPALMISLVLLKAGKPTSFWLAGFIFLVWAILGFTVEYVFNFRWRNPINWPIFIPYVTLYLGTIMFYWFPVGALSRQLWYVYAVLFVLSTYLNVTSH